MVYFQITFNQSQTIWLNYTKAVLFQTIAIPTHQNQPISSSRFTTIALSDLPAYCFVKWNIVLIKIADDGTGYSVYSHRYNYHLYIWQLINLTETWRSPKQHYWRPCFFLHHFYFFQPVVLPAQSWAKKPPWTLQLKTRACSLTISQISINRTVLMNPSTKKGFNKNRKRYSAQLSRFHSKSTTFDL